MRFRALVFAALAVLAQACDLPEWPAVPQLDNSDGGNDGTGNDFALLALAVGPTDACAVLPSNELYCWGDNTYNQLGVSGGTMAMSPLPIKNPMISNVGEVAVDVRGAICVITGAGVVQCIGPNGFGDLGDGTQGAKSTFVTPVFPGGNMLSGSNGFCVNSSASPFCWGSSRSFSPDDMHVPTQIAGPANVAAVVEGPDHGCTIASPSSTASTLWCWGDDTFGELGDGVCGGSGGTTGAVQAGSISAREVAPGTQSTCFLSFDGTVQCFGNFGASMCTTAPQPITGLSTVTGNLVAGDGFYCAGASDGVYCWGTDANGELGDAGRGGSSDGVAVKVPRFTAPPKLLAAGGSEACALGQDNKLLCWGKVNGATQAPSRIGFVTN